MSQHIGRDPRTGGLIGLALGLLFGPISLVIAAARVTAASRAARPGLRSPTSRIDRPILLPRDATLISR